MEHRLRRLRAALAATDLPGLIVGAPANRRYLSGFTASYGWLLITEGHAVVLTDSRYIIQARHEAPGFAVRQIVSPGKTLVDIVLELCRETGLDRLGFEAGHTTIAEHGRLAAGLGDVVALRPTEGLIEGLRMVKDEAEIALMRRAIAITDAVMDAVTPQLRPGHTERQAAWLFEQALREAGADGPSFPVIVAAGHHAALPHHRPGHDTLGEGRAIIIDMGARLDGYNADLTRTVVIGQPDERFRAIHATVLDAQQRAIAGVRPGVRAHQIDAIARDAITAAGHGEHFGHGTGHGIGIDVHEAPFLRWTTPGGTSLPLEAGMIFSIEPGIYVEGWGGVRIEDLVLVIGDGCEVLSRAVKQRR
jgi:Xaa-Pro aminopeptidase